MHAVVFYAVGDHYIGCYKDTTDRDLNHEASLTNYTYFRPITCTAYCRVNGYRYAGTQAGNLCFCGNSYGSKVYLVIP